MIGQLWLRRSWVMVFDSTSSALFSGPGVACAWHVVPVLSSAPVADISYLTTLLVFNQLQT